MFISAIIFIIVLLIIGLIFLLLGNIRNAESNLIQERIETQYTKGSINEVIDITRKRRLFSSIPWLNSLFLQIPLLNRIDRTLQQSGLKYPLGIFILISFVLAVTGFFVFSSYVINSFLIALFVAGFLGMTPIYYIYAKSQHNLQKLERQLPEALDFIARSVKAGNSFSGGLQLAAKEFDNPLGGEFNKVVNEINFGAPIDEALTRLSNRVDCDDLKFFTLAITLQLETGGNIAEISENIAHIIRERFKIKQHVRTLSAEGKFSAYILVAIPIFISVILAFINPDYIGTLVSDPIGNYLIILAISTTVIGVFLMKKIITIKV